MTDDLKYVTFKREDWERMVSDYQERPTSEESFRKWKAKFGIGDAVVIRTQDAFASAALHTYANSIAISAKVLGELAPSTRDRLMKIADYFHERAVEADAADTKLPD